MEEKLWEEDFQWVDQPLMSDEEYGRLSTEEKVKREEVLAELLGAHIGRYVLIKNASIIASSYTLGGILERKGGDFIHYVPYEGQTSMGWVVPKPSARTPGNFEFSN